MDVNNFLRLLSINFVLVKAKYGCKEFDYLPCIKNETLTGHVIKSSGIMVPGLKTCQRECFNEDLCVSYNLGPVEGQTRTCELSGADHWMRPKFLVSKEGFEYCPIKNPCSSNPCPAGRLCTPDFSWDTFSCDDGGWTQWGSWSPPCVVGCTSLKKRKRSCSNPGPQNQGLQCIGEAEDTEECQTKSDFKHIGCFKDTGNRALPIQLKAKGFCPCAHAALFQGYEMFGLQAGGIECFSGPSVRETYNKYGPSSKCRNGIGGSYSNDVYELKGP